MAEKPVINDSGKVEFSNEEVNLKDVFRKIISYLWEFLYLWWVIVSLALFMGYTAHQAALATPQAFRAHCVFMVSDKKEEIVYNYQASVDYGIGEATTVEYNLDKIVQLSMSKRVIYTSLFERVVVDSLENFLINHIMEEYGLKEKWSRNNPLMKDLEITHDTIAEFDRLQLTALKNVFFLITGQGGEGKLCTSSFDQDSGFISIASTTTSEALSIELTKAIFKNLSEFYIYSESEKQREIYNLVQEETDSLRGEITSAQRRLLAYNDRNMGLSRQQYDANKLILEEEVHKLTIIFAEAVKDMQSSEMALRNKIPFIVPIDMPSVPIRPSKPSPSKAFVTNAIIGTILAMVYIVLRRVLLNVWHGGEEEKEIKPITSKGIIRLLRVHWYLLKRKFRLSRFPRTMALIESLQERFRKSNPGN